MVKNVSLRMNIKFKFLQVLLSHLIEAVDNQDLIFTLAILIFIITSPDYVCLNRNSPSHDDLTLNF